MIKVISYNILAIAYTNPKYYPGKEISVDPMVRSEQISQRLGLMTDSRPQVVLLQEDDYLWKNVQLKEIYDYFHIGWDSKTNSWSSSVTAPGLTILISKELCQSNCEEYRFSVGNPQNQRPGLAVKVGGVVYATFHLTGNPVEEQLRGQELQEISAQVKQFANGLPVVIAGDSNELPEDTKPAYNVMRQNWGDAYTLNQQPTFSTPLIHPKRVDWIGCDQIMIQAIVDVPTIVEPLPTSTEPSDHLPIGIVFKF